MQYCFYEKVKQKRHINCSLRKPTFHLAIKISNFSNKAISIMYKIIHVRMSNKANNYVK